MKRQNILFVVGALAYTLVVFRVHKKMDKVSPRDTIVMQKRTTNKLFPQDISTLYFIDACIESVDTIVATLPSSRWRLEIKGSYNDDIIARKHRVHADVPPFRIHWASRPRSLIKFVDHFCYESKGQRIPKVVHYVWFGRNYFRPKHLMSVLSAVRFIKPCAILFHADQLPFGDHWRLLLQLIPEVVHIVHKQPDNIFGHEFGFIQHKSDIVRLQVLYALGGIYLDGDQLVTASLTRLLQHDLVMSHENEANLANSMMLSSPGARLVALWLAQYRTYNATQWGTHSTVVPWQLAQLHPGLITVVDKLFVNPDFTYIRQVYTGQFDLDQNFGLHLYTRFLRKPLPLLAVARWQSSLGRLWRKILFGTSEMIVCPPS